MPFGIQISFFLPKLPNSQADFVEFASVQELDLIELYLFALSQSNALCYKRLRSKGRRSETSGVGSVHLWCR